MIVDAGFNHLTDDIILLLQTAERFLWPSGSTYAYKAGVPGSNFGYGLLFSN